MMKLNRVTAITKKELLQIWRDPISLAMAFLMPVILLVIYGYAITFDVNNIRTAVLDRDNSALSRELLRQFTSSGYFTIVRQLDDERAIDAVLDGGIAKVVITIPVGFEKQVRTGTGATVGIAIDGSDSNTANIANGYISLIADRFTATATGRTAKPLIEIRNRVWFNPDLKSRNYIVPGLIAMIMSIIIALLSSLTIAKEWERGTMEQLISTPVKPLELIVGKIIPYFIIGFIDLVLAIAMGTLLFEVPLHGSLPLLLALSSIFLFGGVSLGVIISINSGGSQAAASQSAMLATFLPAFMLSGFIFSIANMPLLLQFVTYVVPARYFVTILKGIFMKGSGFHLLWIETALLTAYGAIVFTRAVRKLQKRIG